MRFPVLLAVALVVAAAEARADDEESIEPQPTVVESIAAEPPAPLASPSTIAAEPPAAAAPPSTIAAEPAPAIASTSQIATPTRKAPFIGDDYRYGKLWLIPRGVLSGAIGIPASIGTWDAQDVARFAAVTLTTISLMLPTDPSADVRIQRRLRGSDHPGLDRMFPKIYTIPMTLGIVAYTTALSASFFFFKKPKLREYVSLMLESLGVTQFYHVALKLMIGREGPYHGSREGHIHGPTQLSFPGGTPSGHAASAFAILVTAAEYYGGWPMKLVCYLASVYLATSFFYNHQHFLSDVIWGAAMGDYVAKWVVRHRASDARPANRRSKIDFSPMAFPGGGGLQLSLRGGSFL
jgi:membrane-associated phospholipid phosphatase